MSGIDRNHQLLLMLLASDPAQSPFAAAFAEGAAEGIAAIDWDGFAQLVQRHRVAALVHSGLEQHSDISPPEALRAAFAQAMTANAHRLMATVRLADELATSLSSKNIPYAILKGYPLACQHYPDAAQREMIDLDLLVGEEGFVEAEALVLARGFERSFPDFPVDARIRAGLFRLHNGFSYLRRADAMQIDLHWRTIQYAALLPEIDRNWGDYLIEVEAGGRKTRVLRPDYHLVYVIAHGAKHGWMRLKWLVDIDRMLRTLDPETINLASELVVRARLGPLVGGSLGLARDLLGTPVPDAMGGFLETAGAARITKQARGIVLGEAVARHSRLADLPSFLRRTTYTIGLHRWGGFRREALLQMLARHSDLRRFPLAPGQVWLLALLSPVTALLELAGLLRPRP